MSAEETTTGTAPRSSVGAAIARGVTGLAVVALVGAVAYGADLRAPEPTSPVAADTVTLLPAATVAVCAGPTQLAAPGDATDPLFDPSPVGTVSAVSAVVVPPTTVTDPFARSLDGTPAQGGVAAGAGATVADAPAGAALWTAPGADGAVLSAGTSSSLTAAGDLRGLAAAPCQAPTVDQWLVAGGTEVGSSARLVVQNPSRTAATVTLEVFGPDGLVELAGTSVLSVPAGGRASTLLEGVAASQRRIAVHVQSSGALVTSTRPVSALDGVGPLGTDLVASGAAPTTRQVLAGIVTPGSAVGADGPAVRLLSPAQDATVRLALYGAGGRVLLPGADGAELTAGVVTDVSLAGLPAGEYAVLVESDAPVVASASTPRAGTDGTDAAVVSSQDLSGLTGLAGAGATAVPAGVRPTVVLGAVPESVDSVPGTLAAGLDGVTPPAPPVAPTDAPAAPGARAQVTVLDRAGTVVLDQVVDVAAGTTSTLRLAQTLPGVAVGAVVVREVGADGAPVVGTSTRLAWGIELAADAQDGTTDSLVAAVAPTPRFGASTELTLRAGTRVGLD